MTIGMKHGSSSTEKRTQRSVAKSQPSAHLLNSGLETTKELTPRHENAVHRNSKCMTGKISESKKIYFQLLLKTEIKTRSRGGSYALRLWRQ